MYSPYNYIVVLSVPIALIVDNVVSAAVIDAAAITTVLAATAGHGQRSCSWLLSLLIVDVALMACLLSQMI